MNKKGGRKKLGSREGRETCFEGEIEPKRERKRKIDRESE